jgi:aminoglycoside phosphotransferase family enzyme
MSPLKEDLLNPAALPDKTQKVSLVQTHISMVFIADAFVYKIKKPVKLDFLDFSTIAKREYYCHQEVRLNQRLSRDLYLGVLPVTLQGGHYRIGEGLGEIVDYAVKMRKIPEEKLMERLFLEGRLGRKHVKAVADVLARFHRNAERSPEIDAFGRPEAFKINTDENFEETKKYINVTLPEEYYRALSEWTEAFFRENRTLFLRRIEEGKIRDCHGDLRMEHVCLTDPVYIFDCIEFNERFRYGDTVADLAFLLMDLEYHGGGDLSRQLWQFYTEQTGEEKAESVLRFYKIYRAYVRGKVNSFLLDDPQVSRAESEEAAQRAENYFQLAHSYI